MNEMIAFTPADAQTFSAAGQRLMQTIEDLEPLTVAIVEGDAFGGALDLLMAFDLRIATPGSRFSHPGARIGIVTGFGGTSRWRKIAKPAAASALFLENGILDATTALELGILTHASTNPLALVQERIASWCQAKSRVFAVKSPEDEAEGSSGG